MDHKMPGGHTVMQESLSKLLKSHDTTYTLFTKPSNNTIAKTSGQKTYTKNVVTSYEVHAPNHAFWGLNIGIF